MTLRYLLKMQRDFQQYEHSDHAATNNYHKQEYITSVPAPAVLAFGKALLISLKREPRRFMCKCQINALSLQVPKKSNFRKDKVVLLQGRASQLSQLTIALIPYD